MRIGIIGAGISGLSAAHFLLKKGYKDICVIEADGRVGGKCLTVNYNGKTYEMGSSMGLPSHYHIKQLMKQFRIKPSGISLTRGHFRTDGQLATQLAKDQRREFIMQLKRLPEILKQYPWLKTVGFNDYPVTLAVTFSEWCAANDLQVLEKIYEQCFTTFGFGHIQRVPAGYVLKMVTYENLMGFLEISRIITWSKGTGTLLQRMADQVPELRLTQAVTKIEVLSGEGSNNGKKQIAVTLNSGTQYFDRLIYAADMPQLKALMALDHHFTSMLDAICEEVFYVYAFKLKGIPELCGYVPENLVEERKGHLTVWYHQWPLDQHREMVTVYAYGDASLSEAERVKIVIEDLEKLGCSGIQLYFSKAWRHFPHYESTAIEDGIFNELNALQGKDGIYYVNELVAGTSMEACAAYSEALVEKFF